jgi:SAM-dependent methyltransferase
MSSVVWHEVECGAYDADLPLWEELAGQTEGPILDLGCGSGRVALHLARRGHQVTGLDFDADLVAAFAGRAAGLSAEALTGDARDFEMVCGFGLVLAPMQLLQLFGSTTERQRCLRRAAVHLAPDGLAAFAVVERMPTPAGDASPLPDTREVDGWVYSSLPVDIRADNEAIRVRRLRQTVSPQGEFGEELHEVTLSTLDAATLEAEGAEVGLVPAGRREVPPTDAHVGSTVVLFGREA